MARKGTSYYGLRPPLLGQAADILRDIEGGILPETVSPGAPAAAAAAPPAEPTILGIPSTWFYLGAGALVLWWLSNR